jgi:hypothetical protein
VVVIMPPGASRDVFCHIMERAWRLSRAGCRVRVLGYPTARYPVIRFCLRHGTALLRGRNVVIIDDDETGVAI